MKFVVLVCKLFFCPELIRHTVFIAPIYCSFGFSFYCWIMPLPFCFYLYYLLCTICILYLKVWIVSVRFIVNDTKLIAIFIFCPVVANDSRICLKYMNRFQLERASKIDFLTILE